MNAAPGFAVLGLHHMGVTVPDLARAEAFFIEVFGFRRVAFEASPARLDAAAARRLNARAGAEYQAISLLRCGRGFLELFQYADPAHSGAKSSGSPPLSSDPGGSHVAIEVGDIHAAAAALQAAGAQLCSGVNVAATPGFEGLSWLYAMTPWGQTIEIVQLSPDAQTLKP